MKKLLNTLVTALAFASFNPNAMVEVQKIKSE